MDKNKQRVGRPNLEKTNYNLNVRLDAESLKRLASIAKKNGITKNEQAKHIILNGLNSLYTII